MRTGIRHSPVLAAMALASAMGAGSYGMPAMEFKIAPAPKLPEVIRFGPSSRRTSTKGRVAKNQRQRRKDRRLHAAGSKKAFRK